MEKPYWMTDHEASDGREFEALHKEIKELKDLLEPISQTYSAVSFLGKWGMAILVFVSIFIGVILGLKELLTHK